MTKNKEFACTQLLKNNNLIFTVWEWQWNMNCEWIPLCGVSCKVTCFCIYSPHCWDELKYVRLLYSCILFHINTALVQINPTVNNKLPL